MVLAGFKYRAIVTYPFISQLHRCERTVQACDSWNFNVQWYCTEAFCSLLKKPVPIFKLQKGKVLLILMWMYSNS